MWLAVSLTAFFIFAAAAHRLISTPGRVGAWIVLLVACALASGPVNAAKVLASDADRSPYRPFEDRGFTATVNWLNADLDSSGAVLCPKDLGFYLGRRHYPSEGTQAELGGEGLVDLVRSRKVSYVVDSELYPTLAVITSRAGALGLTLRARIGDYVVYAVQ
jgi:hypothetical protein